MPPANANTEASNITATDHKAGKSGGAEAAAAQLNQDYLAELKSNGNNTQEANTWLKNVNAQLQTNGVLPDVTIGVLHGAVKSGDVTSPNGTVNGSAAPEYSKNVSSTQQSFYNQELSPILTGGTSSNQTLNNEVNTDLNSKGTSYNLNEIASFQNNQNGTNSSSSTTLSEIFQPAKGELPPGQDGPTLNLEPQLFTALSKMDTNDTGGGNISQSDLQAALKDPAQLTKVLQQAGYSGDQLTVAAGAVLQLSANWNQYGAAGLLSKNSNGYYLTPADLNGKLNPVPGDTPTAVTAPTTTDNPTPPASTTTTPATGDITANGVTIKAADVSNVLKNATVTPGGSWWQTAETLAPGASNQQWLDIVNALLTTNGDQTNAPPSISANQALLTQSNMQAFLTTLSASDSGAAQLIAQQSTTAQAS